MMEPAGELPMPEDERSGRPYLLGRSLLLAFVVRVVSVLVLAVIDVAGLAVGLLAALALRSLVRLAKCGKGFFKERFVDVRRKRPLCRRSLSC